MIERYSVHVHRTPTGWCVQEFGWWQARIGEVGVRCRGYEHGCGHPGSDPLGLCPLHHEKIVGQKSTESGESGLRPRAGDRVLATDGGNR